jgi:hypothetical protein
MAERRVQTGENGVTVMWDIAELWDCSTVGFFHRVLYRDDPQGALSDERATKHLFQVVSLDLFIGF